MQLQHLTYFVAVAETRHFTNAAELCRVAQPSLSKQIRSLEHELGAPLFNRVRGDVTLTQAGEALLPLARRILADVETAKVQIQELAGLRRGRVRLGATPSLCAGLLADAIAVFRERYPSIEIQVEENGSRDLVDDLSRGGLDLALIISPLPDGHPTLAAAPLLRENLVAVAPAGAPPLTGEPELPITALRDHPIVMFRRGYDLRESTTAACRAAGFEPEFAIEGGEMDAVLRFVEAGLGLAVVPSMVLAGRPGLRGTPVTGLTRTIALAHRTDVEAPHAARAFQAELTAFIGAAARRNQLPHGLDMLI